MNINILSQILRVKKGTFVNSTTAEVIPYASIYVVEKNLNSDDDVGLEISKISLDPSLFDQAKQLCLSNKYCSIDVDVSSSSDGKFKLKATSIKEVKDSNSSVAK